MKGELYMTENSLTKRELEVLSLMAKGYSNAEIVKELFISKTTLTTYIASLYKKLKIYKSSDSGGSEYRVRVVLKFLQMQKEGLITNA